MNGEYFNTILIISIITVTSVLLLPLIAWVIGYQSPQERETLT